MPGQWALLIFFDFPHDLFTDFTARHHQRSSFWWHRIANTHYQRQFACEISKYFRPISWTMKIGFVSHVFRSVVCFVEIGSPIVCHQSPNNCPGKVLFHLFSGRMNDWKWVQSSRRRIGSRPFYIPSKLYNRLFILFALPVVYLIASPTSELIYLKTSNAVNSSLQITKLYSVDAPALARVYVCVLSVNGAQNKTPSRSFIYYYGVVRCTPLYLQLRFYQRQQHPIKCVPKTDTESRRYTL